jgi:hypothetical protein
MYQHDIVDANSCRAKEESVEDELLLSPYSEDQWLVVKKLSANLHLMAQDTP